MQRLGREIWSRTYGRGKPNQCVAPSRRNSGTPPERRHRHWSAQHLASTDSRVENPGDKRALIPMFGFFVSGFLPPFFPPPCCSPLRQRLQDMSQHHGCQGSVTCIRSAPAHSRMPACLLACLPACLPACWHVHTCTCRCSNADVDVARNTLGQHGTFGSLQIPDQRAKKGLTEGVGTRKPILTSHARVSRLFRAFLPPQSEGTQRR